MELLNCALYPNISFLIPYHNCSENLQHIKVLKYKLYNSRQKVTKRWESTWDRCRRLMIHYAVSNNSLRCFKQNTFSVRCDFLRRLITTNSTKKLWIQKHILRFILHILQVNQDDFLISQLEFSALTDKPQISQ